MFASTVHCPSRFVLRSLSLLPVLKRSNLDSWSNLVGLALYFVGFVRKSVKRLKLWKNEDTKGKMK